MRARAAVGLLAVVCLATAGAAQAAAGAETGAVGAPTAEGNALQAARSALLVRIAVLSDQADLAHAGLVAAQLQEVTTGVAAATARAALVEHAVQAFVHAGSAGTAARSRGAVFAEVIGDVDRVVADAVGQAEAAAEAQHAAATSALADTRHSAEEVDAVRAELEATIAVHEVRTEAARAEEARNALARRLAEEQAASEAAARAESEAAARAESEAIAQASAREAAGEASARGASEAAPRSAAAAARGTPADGGASRHQTDRNSRATAAQGALMAAHPFGPAAGPPPGARLTGAVLEGPASWYGPGFDGRPTASGAVYDQMGWTVASRELPLGTVLLLTRGGRSVIVLVNDRGPYVAGRVLDLSRGVAEELGTIHAGVANVRAQVLSLP